MPVVVVTVAGLVAAGVLLRAARRAETRARVRALREHRRARLPGWLRAPLVRALRDADVDVDPETALQVWVLAVCTATVAGAAVSPVVALGAGLATLAGGPVGLRTAHTRRARRFAAALPAALEQVAADLRGGGTVGGAVARLGAGTGPVAADFRRVEVRARLGLGLGDALAAWPVEHDTPGVRAAAGALAVAATLGGRAADAIDGLAASLRQRLGAAAEAAALSAQARLSALVVGTAPLGYVVVSGLADPGSATRLVATGVGRACLVAGLVLEALAAWWMRRIVRTEA